jgi:hypothetical protein
MVPENEIPADLGKSPCLCWMGFLLVCWKRKAKDCLEPRLRRVSLWLLPLPFFQKD